MKVKKLNHRRIICVSVMQNRGGGEEFLLNLCRNINNYEFLIASPEGDALNNFIGNSLRTVTINSLKKLYRKSGWNLISFLKIILNIKLSTLRLLRTFKTEKPALVLANGLFAALYVLPAVILSKKKIIVVQHLIFNKDSIEKKIINYVHRKAEKIVCVSNAVKENVLMMLNQPDSNKIIVIPNGTILPETELINRRSSAEIKIGIVGSILRIKGIHLIIEALKDVLKSGNVNLHIFGTAVNDKDSIKYETELKQLVKSFTIEEKVYFEGHQESKEFIYKNLDLVISYSLIAESFSFTVIEAMAFKKIVIAADAGGPKEIITDGETGFLAPPQNVDSLKEKIKYCLNNIGTEIFERIREKAYERVKNEYSMERFSERYMGLFNSLIGDDDKNSNCA